MSTQGSESFGLVLSVFERFDLRFDNAFFLGDDARDETFAFSSRVEQAEGVVLEWDAAVLGENGYRSV